MVIRKDHVDDGFPRGDLFEMILIQVKGGNARWPSDADIVRLRAVANRYNVRDVVLAEHKSGTKPAFYRLNRTERGNPRAEAWTEADPAEVFK